MPISNKDLQNAIVPARADKPTFQDNNERETIAFGKGGKELPEDDVDVLAKAVRVGTRTVYYVLSGPNNHLFNPNDVNYDDSHRQRKQDQFRSRYALRQTNQKVFNLYLSFLETNNRSLLLNAERER